MEVATTASRQRKLFQRRHRRHCQHRRLRRQRLQIRALVSPVDGLRWRRCRRL